MFCKRMSMKFKMGIMVIFVAVITLFAVTSSFASLAIDFSTDTDWFNENSVDLCLGWSFTANKNLYVNALGFYAALDNPAGYRIFSVPHEVGIFDANQNLIASATVGNTDLLNGFFRQHSLETPVSLMAGSIYYIMASIGGTDNYAFNPTGFTVNPNITFGVNQYAEGSTLVFPSGSDGPFWLGYFGPNMDITPATIPIPVAGLLLGSGIAGLMLFRRKYTA
jgi:hypothetical protein